MWQNLSRTTQKKSRNTQDTVRFYLIDKLDPPIVLFWKLSRFPSVHFTLIQTNENPDSEIVYSLADADGVRRRRYNNH